MRSFLPLTAMILVSCTAMAAPVHGQIISPGELSEPHAELEGMRNCTGCHELRARGIADGLCLDCHAALETRVRRGAGYHATVGRDCAQCHKEHFGREFTLVRWDPETFDHSSTGYDLAGAHVERSCGDCHRAGMIRDREVLEIKASRGALSRTYLGLDVACISCHERDDPHADQFAERTCDDCHADESFEGAERFDHSTTPYRLTGRHRDAPCAGCHVSDGAGAASVVLYAGVPAETCTACHSDEHEGRMGAGCEECHTTGGWHRIDGADLENRFDHSTTPFTLAGAHLDASCGRCHSPAAATSLEIRIVYAPGTERFTYARPIADDCLSCHVDRHDGALAEAPGGSVCDNCHGAESWLPSMYGLARHNRETDHELTGAHLATPCLACHRESGSPEGALDFAPEASSCRSCHAGDDPHDSQFDDRGCKDCHGSESFTVLTFDHDSTRYPLDGEHRNVACEGCHPVETGADGGDRMRFSPLEMECSNCHGDMQ